jgi:TorA maturation chaperone TorD
MKTSSVKQAKPKKHALPPHFSNLEETARNRARIFEILAAVFNQMPDIQLVKALKSMGGDFWEELKKYGDMNPDVQQGLLELSNFSGQIGTLEDSEVEQSLRVDWTRLFRGLRQDYGPTPPYEALYLQQTANEMETLHSIAHTYSEYGLVCAEGSSNRQDYLGLECDFLRHLSEKEADAWVDGEQEQATRYNQATSTFFSEHPGRWVSAFCDQAAPSAGTDFYRGFLHLTKGIISDASMQRNQT